ncbi:MAG TPA: nucleotide exchange factor GrpE [Acidimicrobiales bacterium]|nr:nucleotide exchange factor GrpE [Acidimicrobiales bacterium]
MTGDDPLVETGQHEPELTDEGRDVVPEDGPAPGAAAETTPGDLASLTAERDEYLDALRRLQAEFENFRKRTLRQQTDLLSRASEGVMEKLFPVLDALDLALAHAGEKVTTAAHLKDALAQINALLRDTLSQEGLERIDACEVPFDPTIHDAVAHIPRDATAGPDDETETPTDDGAQVVEIMRAGYRLKGRVLRPAMVKVKG